MFQNSTLVDFMSMKLPYFPELVKVVYNNLKIQDGVLYSEVHSIPIVVDQSLFYSRWCSLLSRCFWLFDVAKGGENKGRIYHELRHKFQS